MRRGLRAQARPGSVALVVACEPITHGMGASNDLDFVTNLALLRMGAAAVLLTNRSAARGRCCASAPWRALPSGGRGVVRDAASAWWLSGPRIVLITQAGLPRVEARAP